jgi:hypothetical protein
VPEVPPPHPERDGAVPGAAGEGKGRCGSHHPRALTPGVGPGGHRGVKPSPLPGMRGYGAPRSFQDVPGPGAGPLGGESLRPDRAGAGGRGKSVHPSLPPACGGKG